MRARRRLAHLKPATNQKTRTSPLYRAPDCVIRNQKNNCPKGCHQKAMQVESVHSNVAKHVKQPTADDRANDAQQDIQHHALATMIYNVTCDKSRDQSQENPNE